MAIANLSLKIDISPRYAPPSQMVLASALRWALVFEDPGSRTLWLGKGLHRKF